MTAVAILHREEIIEQVATGAYLRDIAKKFGTSPGRISDNLKADPQYLQAREVALEIRLEDREQALETAPPLMAEISRATALLRQANWRCEREAPHRWGAKQEITHHGGAPALQITIVQASVAEPTTE